MRWLFDRWEYVVPLVAGIGLRILYVLVTSYSVRMYDVYGHIDYIHFLLDNWVLPPPHDGWQFYQPPLYYLISAVIMKGVQVFSQDPETGYRILQWFSFLLTLVTLGISAWITHMLFPRDKQKAQRFLFLSLLAVIPSAVYFAARINNDVLYLVFAYLSMALLIRWWQKPSALTWVLLCNALAIGLLAKSNAILLFFPAFAALLFRPKIGWTHKAVLTMAFLLIPFCVSAWFALPPFFREGDKRAAVVGNAAEMTGPIPIEAKYLLTFNPVQVLANPFNVVSGEKSRRLYLWEYMFRSALFGEFSYVVSLVPLAIVMLMAALVLSAFAVYESVFDILRWRSSATFPLWWLGGAILLGAFFLRIAMPFSSSQDFRYSIGLLIPVCYYALCRKKVKSRRWVLVQEISSVVFITASAAFLMALAFIAG